MFYAYALKSDTHNRFYYGHTEDLNARLKIHNSGKTKSIRPYLPFKLVYFEEFESRELAIQRERYFKTAAGRRFIKKQLEGSLPD